jgi:hypothetical protein
MVVAMLAAGWRLRTGVLPVKRVADYRPDRKRVRIDV